MSLSSEDLAGSLLMILLVVVIVGLAVAFGVARARRNGNRAVALSVVRVLSLWFLLLNGLGIVLALTGLTFNRGVSLEGDLESWVSDTADGIPSCGDAAHESGPRYCGGYIEEADLGSRVVLAIATILILLASAAIAYAIFVAAYHAEQGVPFDSAVAGVFFAVGITVAGTGVLGDLLRQIGATFAARALPWESDDLVPFFLTVPLWPFAVMLGCFALSAIFRHGAQLQRETEGLV